MTPQALLDILRDNAHVSASVLGPDHPSVVNILEMRKTVLVLIHSNEELARALGDAISVFEREPLDQLERQEAWIAALKLHSVSPAP